ncbi:NrsF family protein [Blastomonas sp.]|uniref:NrsF family protein n=1 Tax=Blastomonas sp. TaxID=1909299 RepID=UPI00359487A6
MPDPRATTAALIARLARDTQPVRPLSSPLRRGLLWGLATLTFGAFMAWAVGLRPDMGQRLTDGHFLLEQGAALATGLSAAIAALALTIPASARALRLLPVVPGALWLGTLGWGCLRDAQTAGVQITPDPACFLYIALIGSLPAALLVSMLRKGVPLAPRLTIAFAGLAAAGLGNVALRFFHMQDGALMVLIWQVGSVGLLAWLFGLAGRSMLPWPVLSTRRTRS